MLDRLFDLELGLPHDMCADPERRVRDLVFELQAIVLATLRPRPMVFYLEFVTAGSSDFELEFFGTSGLYIGLAVIFSDSRDCVTAILQVTFKSIVLAQCGIHSIYSRYFDLAP